MIALTVGQLCAEHIGMRIRVDVHDGIIRRIIHYPSNTYVEYTPAGVYYTLGPSLPPDTPCAVTP